MRLASTPALAAVPTRREAMAKFIFVVDVLQKMLRCVGDTADDCVLPRTETESRIVAAAKELWRVGSSVVLLFVFAAAEFRE